MLLDIGSIDERLLAGPVDGVERDGVSRMRSLTVIQAARTYILDAGVHRDGDIGDGVDCVGSEIELQPSVFISATSCLIRRALGSVKMRRKSSRVARGLHADQRPPLRLGDGSDTLAMSNAPEAVNRMWSV